MKGITTEVESDRKNNRRGSVFKAIKVLAKMNAKQLYNAVTKIDGSPCNSADDVMLRWCEHFESALIIPAGTS